MIYSTCILETGVPTVSTIYPRHREIGNLISFQLSQFGLRKSYPEYPRYQALCRVHSGYLGRKKWTLA